MSIKSFFQKITKEGNKLNRKKFFIYAGIMACLLIIGTSSFLIIKNKYRPSSGTPIASTVTNEKQADTEVKNNKPDNTTEEKPWYWELARYNGKTIMITKYEDFDYDFNSNHDPQIWVTSRLIEKLFKLKIRRVDGGIVFEQPQQNIKDIPEHHFFYTSDQSAISFNGITIRLNYPEEVLPTGRYGDDKDNPYPDNPNSQGDSQIIYFRPSVIERLLNVKITTDNCVLNFEDQNSIQTGKAQ